MKEKAMLLKFVRFLKRNGAYQKYVQNLQKHNSLIFRAQSRQKINAIDYILDSIVYENGEFLISSAFIWSDTIEGENYWRNIQTKWYDINDYKINL